MNLRLQLKKQCDLRTLFCELSDHPSFMGQIGFLMHKRSSGPKRDIAIRGQSKNKVTYSPKFTKSMA